MISLTALDTVCVRQIVKDAPITFGFGGVDFQGTAVGWRTAKELTEGGFHDDIREKQILVAQSQFEGRTPPEEKAVLTVCVDRYGVPCLAGAAAGARVSVRVQEIGRAGGGLSYVVSAETRG